MLHLLTKSFLSTFSQSMPPNPAKNSIYVIKFYPGLTSQVVFFGVKTQFPVSKHRVFFSRVKGEKEKPGLNQSQIFNLGLQRSPG